MENPNIIRKVKRKAERIEEFDKVQKITNTLIFATQSLVVIFICFKISKWLGATIVSWWILTITLEVLKYKTVPTEREMKEFHLAHYGIVRQEDTTDEQWENQMSEF